MNRKRKVTFKNICITFLFAIVYIVSIPVGLLANITEICYNYLWDLLEKIYGD